MGMGEILLQSAAQVMIDYLIHNPEVGSSSLPPATITQGPNETYTTFSVNAFENLAQSLSETLLKAW